jgi:hypothetical protein
MDFHPAVLVVGAALLIAVYQVSLHRLVTAVPDALGLALERLYSWLVGVGDGLARARTRLLVDCGLDGGRWRTTAVLGGLIAGVAVLLILVLSESVMVGLAMESLGLGSARLLPALARLGGLDVISTVATVTCGLHAIWALKAFAPDSQSVLVVLDWHPPSSRRLLRWCAAVAAAGVLISVVGLAVVRAVALQEADRLDTLATSTAAVPVAADGADPASTEYVRVVRSARTVVGVASAVATLAEAAVAFALSLDLLAHLPVIAVACLMACVAIVRWTVAGAHGVIRAARHLLSLIVTAVAWIATPAARAPTELLRGLHGWASAARPVSALARGVRGTVAALTAVGHDFQLPPADRMGPAWATDMTPGQDADLSAQPSWSAGPRRELGKVDRHEYPPSPRVSRRNSEPSDLLVPKPPQAVEKKKYRDL